MTTTDKTLIVFQKQKNGPYHDTHMLGMVRSLQSQWYLGLPGKELGAIRCPALSSSTLTPLRNSTVVELLSQFHLNSLHRWSRSDNPFYKLWVLTKYARP